jgi:predicted transposase/invertase (TIGR01784 family)
MRTIADSYIEEGFNKGLVRGIEKGREEGREEGIQAGMEKAASNMLKSNLDLKFISSVTGLPIEILQKLKASL